MEEALDLSFDRLLMMMMMMMMMMYETRELCCVGQDECVVVTMLLIAIHRSDREHLVALYSVEVPLFMLCE